MYTSLHILVILVASFFKGGNSILPQEKNRRKIKTFPLYPSFYSGFVRRYCFKTYVSLILVMCTLVRP